MTPSEEKMGFFSHLAELRKRLINSFIFLIIFFIGCYFFAEYIYGFLVEPFAKAVKDQLCACKRFYLFSQVAASLDPAVGLRPPSAP